MRNKVGNAILLGLIALSVFTLLSCGQDSSSSVDIGDVKWVEQKEKVANWNDYLTFTEYDGVRYAFNSKNFNDVSARKAIGTIATILRNTDSLFPSGTHENFTIYIGFESDMDVSVTSPLMISTKNPLSLDDIWEIMKRAHREELICAEQYGLIYLYCRDNGIIKENSKENAADFKTFFSNPDNLYFLDLNIPMLDDVYFTKEEATILRKTAICFATWYEETYSFDDFMNLCKAIDTCDKETLMQTKNDWLKSIGCTTNYTELGKIPFQYSEFNEPVDKYRTTPSKQKDCLVTYEIVTSDAVWMWDDRDVVSCSYTDMITNYNHIEPLRLQCFAEARDLLKNYLPNNLDKVYIHTYFENGKDDYRGGFFDRNKSIYFTRNWTEVKYSLLHEYVHFLTMGKDRIMPNSKIGQLVEWPAVWVTSYQIDNPLNREAYCEINNITDGSYDRQTARLQTFQYILKRYQTKETMDTNKKITPTEDIPWFVSVDSLFYPEYGAMAEYIYKTYGMDTFIQLLQSNDDFDGILGISFDRLYFNMIQWVQEQVNETDIKIAS